MTLPQNPDTGQTRPASAAPRPRPPRAPAKSAADPAEAARRKRIGRILLAILIALLLYGGYSLVQYQLVGRYLEDTEDAYIQADSVLVSSKLAGYVRGIAVRDNQLVQRGTVLAEVDPTDFANHVADADAQIEVAEANRDGMLAAITEARTGIVQAEAAIASAKRKLAWLNAQVALYRPLAKTGAEPSQTYNQYLSDRDQTEQDVLGREASLVQARARLVAAQAQLRQADAQVKSAQVKQQATQNDLGHSRLIAPISGRVASSALRPGQYVQPGQRLLSIVPTNDIYISANFKETQIGLMRPGQPATVHVDALPGIRFHGYVESITPGTGANFSLIPPQNATGNFTKIVQRVPVRIYLVAGPQSRRVLVPGLSVRVEVDTRSAKNERERIEREATDAK